MIELDGIAELDAPVLLAAFEGWNDAADTATAAIDHLAGIWDARPSGEIDPDEYYDFQVNRPILRSDGELEGGAPGGQRELVWPTTRLLIARPPAAPRDILLLRGLEPNMRWRQFCGELLQLTSDLGVDLAVLFGALLADNPHTRPIPITATTSDPELAQAYGLQPSTYEGPTGIVGVLADEARQAELPTLSIWAAVPHYVAQPPCPKATVGLLDKVATLLDLPIPLGDLPEAALAWERGVDDLAEDDSEVSEYVRSLEQARDAAELPEATGDAIAAEFERYLRRRPGDPPEQS